MAVLFGGEITCRLPLPDVEVSGTGVVWVLDWHPSDPPEPEDFDAAIKRMASEQP